MWNKIKDEWSIISMRKKVTLIGSIATIIGTIFIMFPSAASSTNQTSNGNQSPNIQTLKDSSIIYNNQTTTNYQNSTKTGFFLKNTILLPEPSIKKVHIKYSLCNVENGSKIEILNETTNLTTWIKVKIIDGTCQGKIGWTGKENLIKR
jgi:hypothetical protein